jgi:ribosomal protein L11 methyltransferase
MGTGTGILAILASMRGASQITAIEIDPMAHVNAIDNLKINNAESINLILGDASSLNKVKNIDVFIANINRNIITQDISAYASTLHSGSVMLLSGFYESDIPVIMEYARPLGLTYHSHTVKNDWACLYLVKE